MLMYHFVFTAKYRKVVLTDKVDMTLKEICLEIEKRYELRFLEIGTDEDHVHFLIQSVPMYSPKKIVQMVKSIIARELFTQHPEIKLKLWGGEFWTDGYYVNTVALYGSENAVRSYIKSQGKKPTYQELHRSPSTLFDH
jgi:REP element-mobilizing transposase RayT